MPKSRGAPGSLQARALDLASKGGARCYAVLSACYRSCTPRRLCYGFLGFLLVLSFLLMESQRDGSWIGDQVYHIYTSGILPRWFSAGINGFGQSYLYIHYVLLLSGGKDAKEGYDQAKNYYDQQRPIFMANAKTWRLARPFANVGEFVKNDLSFYGMVGARAKAFVKNRDLYSWDDYRIEKDKCDMQMFIENNGMPTAVTMKIWRQYESRLFWKDVDGLLEDEGKDTYPKLVKSCHISMGHYGSVTLLMDKKTVHSDYVTQKLTKLFDLRPTDFSRSWGRSFDQLTQSIPPGVMIQNRFPNMPSGSPPELKIEVFWGRAYLALIDRDAGTTFPNTYCTNRGAIILRDGTVTSHSGFSWKPEREKCNEWIIKDGHIKYAWHLAEAFAKAANIDAIRVDVFLNPQEPWRAAINEVSLSSGAMYRWHFEFLAKIWREGHLKKEFEVIDVPTAAQKINNGHSWYSRVYSKCKKDLIGPELHKKFCEDQPRVDEEPRGGHRKHNRPHS